MFTGSKEILHRTFNNGKRASLQFDAQQQNQKSYKTVSENPGCILLNKTLFYTDVKKGPTQSTFRE